MIITEKGVVALARQITVSLAAFNVQQDIAHHMELYEQDAWWNFQMQYNLTDKQVEKISEWLL